MTRKPVATISGEADALGERKAQVGEALNQVIESAPPPSPGNDIQHYVIKEIAIQYGGFTNSSKTRVTIDVFDGELP